MENIEAKPKRPLSITLISLLGIYGGFQGFYMAFSSGVENSDTSTAIYFAFFGVNYVLCSIGFWLMKKWAVYLFVGFELIAQIILLSIGHWNIMTLLLPALVMYPAYKNFPKMS